MKTGYERSLWTALISLGIISQAIQPSHKHISLFDPRIGFNRQLCSSIVKESRTSLSLLSSKNSSNDCNLKSREGNSQTGHRM